MFKLVQTLHTVAHSYCCRSRLSLVDFKSHQLFSHLSLVICRIQHLAFITWQETLCTLPSLSQEHAAFCAAAVDSGTKGVRVFQMDHHPRKRIFAEVRVHASVEQVWRVITDYDHLADFVPNLIASKRLPTTTPGRIHLQQLGCSQSVFWRLEAEAVLECVEVHKAMGAKELRFKAIEGDFKVGTVASLVITCCLSLAAGSQRRTCRMLLWQALVAACVHCRISLALSCVV